MKNNTYGVTKEWHDTEWEKAENSNEPKKYYWVSKGDNKGKYIRLYTPALADLVKKRTGYTIIPVKN